MRQENIFPTRSVAASLKYNYRITISFFGLFESKLDPTLNYPFCIHSVISISLLLARVFVDVREIRLMVPSHLAF